MKYVYLKKSYSWYIMYFILNSIKYFMPYLYLFYKKIKNRMKKHITFKCLTFIFKKLYYILILDTKNI